MTLIRCDLCGEAITEDSAENYDGVPACGPCFAREIRELDERNERERAREVARLKGEIPKAALKVPDLATFARDGAPSAVAALAVEEWLAHPVVPLWLYGPPGVGKSTLLARAALARQGEGRGLIPRVVWVPARAVVKAKAKPPPWASLIALDDVGAHRLTPTIVDRLDRWADLAYGRGTPILVTSNLRPTELADAIDAVAGHPAGRRIVRRLFDKDAGAVRIEVARVTFGGGKPLP